ncbi:Potassium voltage-gated channel protein eag [Fasciolopsis buskii]|uniref:Potassium voltage-gated channel protein eag n=1 Tax=Fasciolopsis buskii TaxID=27845 RepID=A0A8E0RYB0_9TREM|nr:Potassium voltage-gated channel protein eag [Fasciolopsis buski]
MSIGSIPIRKLACCFSFGSKTKKTNIFSDLISETGLLVANARIVDYPIVYVNDSFTRMTNYSPRDMLQRGAICTHLHGERTSINAVEKLQHALDNGLMEQVEVTLYKKNKSMIWVIMCVAPIENDVGELRLYLVLFYDISPLRQPMDDDLLRGSLSKFARLARSVARNRAVLSQAEVDDSLTAISPFQKENIPKYRQESPKTPPHVLLHYVTFKTSWDWMIFILTGYTSVAIPFYVAFGSENLYSESLLLALDRIVDTIFLLDIVLNFHTTFVGPTGAVISDPMLIRLNYLKGWFMVDLIASLPYGLLGFLRTSDNTHMANLFVALKFVRLLRLWRVLRKLDQYLEYVAAILLIMIFCFILLAHWLACVWYMVGVYDLKQHVYHGWIIHLANETEGARNWTGFESSPKNKLPPQSMLYMTSLYFTLSLITSIGFGNVAANTTAEKIVSVMFMIIGALVYATIFGNVTTILQQTHASRARLQQLMVNVKDFLRIHNVPKELAERVIDYVTSSWSLTRGVDTDTVLNNCPKDMKADLCVHLYRVVFTEHPAFRLASESCLRALAVSFRTEHHAPGDLIFHQGESIDQLCFVISGSLEVIQDDEVVAILTKGDVFGQPVWKESDIGQSAASVRALTYCDLHCIKRDKLLEVLKFYSAFANSFSRSLVLTYNLRNRLIFRKISDVQREKELNEMHRNQPPLSSLAPDHPVRRLISRFCNAASTTVGQTSSVSSSECRERGAESAASDVTGQTSTTAFQGWGRLLNVQKDTGESRTTAVKATVASLEGRLTSTSSTVGKKLDEQDRLQQEIMEKIEQMRGQYVEKIRKLSQKMDQMEGRLSKVCQLYANTVSQ